MAAKKKPGKAAKKTGKKSAKKTGAKLSAQQPAPRPRGRPPGTKSEKKRGRPPGSEKQASEARDVPRKKRDQQPFVTLKKMVQEAIVAALPEYLKESRIPIEYSREEKFGDYAATAAMDKDFRETLSKRNPACKNPREAGAYLLKQLRASEESSTIFANVEIAGPGFLNISISPSVLATFAARAVKNPETYGRTESAEKRKIIFEFVSANPTGPLNIVSARAAALGDSCCNLLSWAGESVFREYYVNDYGNQIQLLGQSCFLRALEETGIPVKISEKTDQGPVYPEGPGLPFPSEGYHGDIIKDIVQEIRKRKSVLIGPRVVEHARQIAGSPDVPLDFISRHPAMQELSDKLGEAAVSVFLDTQQRDLERFRVKFDAFYRESSLHKQNKVLSARNFLAEYVRTEDGKQIFESKKFGDDLDRVIIREDGRPTYLLADIAYHKTKMDRGFDEIINIWGPDHHGYIKRLAGALVAMGYSAEKFKVLLAQQVNLLEHGQPVVMSKRAGKFVTMDSLMNEIPIDVIRYFFVMRSFEAHLDFDFAEAADTSEKNPYYYVAYAHARICSIQRKALEKGISIPVEAREMEECMRTLEWTADRRRLLYLVARFPEEVQDAARVLEPHRLINFLYHLANALSRFYAPKENRVIDQDERTARGLLVLLSAVATCLKNGLAILGMTAPDRMTREESA
ncbi:MAG: arginine--tRNA ligase [Leptospirales bacterium]|nr:arginine--tRNA ligase [Leptospirales bacterium]HMW59172.1 arginine--tRNA ligase [Leptospiraceae bacterium]HNJ34893.1 arginine--tRNA ligase [Leptospiraceae bacterium]HNL67747.1 arginine--tRNA ligase [Leptospiraceae bacterium]HNN74909.1 arginine--tRNA ligase [Leptospiraceae bacterium]